jgi:hypothetical protein
VVGANCSICLFNDEALVDWRLDYAADSVSMCSPCCLKIGDSGQKIMRLLTRMRRLCCRVEYVGKSYVE